MPKLSPELSFTCLTAAVTGLLWIPIIINRLRERGVWNALRNPQPDVRPEAEWAYRLANAHRNAIENLVVFAPLAIVTHQLGVEGSGTAIAASIFFWSRAAHALIYTLGIPLLRTIAFAVGFGAQAFVFLHLVNAA